MPVSAPAASATHLRCPVCGFPGLQLDQVVLGRSRLLLHECPRCEHRATTSLEAALRAVESPPRHAPLRAKALPDAA